MMRFVRKSGESVLMMVLCAALAAAGVAGFEEGKVNRTRDGVGIRGYDPVAYFDGAPTKGKAEIAYTYQETIYHFASVANRDRFARSPARFVPQYGGFCAWAVSRGYTATIDPLAWKIVADRLYLNYSTGVQKMWEQDEQGNIKRADGNWPNIR
jgi:YHS domain-containing protein